MEVRGSVLTYPLSYLSLKDEGGRRLFRRNSVAVLVVVAVMSAPFILFDANYFGDKGFLDRFGSFAAVLTGFYIAALVGVASFASSVGDLDGEIEVGRISRPVPNPAEGEDLEEYLTRRQYVCSMFGYLAFVSLVLSVGAIMLIVAAAPARSAVNAISGWSGAQTAQGAKDVLRAIVIVGFNLVLAHLLVTTCHGLYYLIDRLYAKKPTLLPKIRRT
ncbi:hypothetical protein [Microvirga massiliensis]|uniref:hypothetical protein n=1 Tax=Microvirga massiliensis TaxID=1033741 RepID=UPI000660BAEF|nr:hypothetical protein [Microvirga massiliensis]